MEPRLNAAHRRVETSVPHKNRRLVNNSLANWKPMKCSENRRDVVVDELPRYLLIGATEMNRPAENYSSPGDN